MESGTVVAGKYRLNQLLGSGGMAEVWSATNTFTERELAIKFMNPQFGKSPEAAARFLKEAKVPARINHPNVIEIHDVGQTDQGQLFLVMELLTGYPLEVALRRQTPPMTLYEFALVMIEVGEALAAAHKNGIVHRDLKPTNIFLHKVRDGVAMPKLLDFGVSKFLEDDQNHALTVAGTVLGSPLYMSPEQARGDSHLDGRTDIFAFGAILFEALCGYRAYEAKNFNALIVKIATSKPKAIDECAPNVPSSLRSVVRSCLETDSKKRVQSFEEIVQLLRAALPELRASEARLPMPIIATAVVDPEATNALPVVRASDRPPPAAAPPPVTLQAPRPSAPPPTTQPLSLAESVPPGAGPSWHTPNTSYASLTVSTPRPHNVWAWLAGGATTLVVAGLAIGVALGWRSRVAAPHATTMTTTTLAPASPSEPPQAASAIPAPAPDPKPEVASDPPSISVDSLPGAAAAAAASASASASTKPVAAVPHGSGQLFVTASPGWCKVTVDGKDRGPTPIAGLDLPAGAHHLRCEAPGAKAKTATVHIHDSTASKHKFALDE